MGVRVVPVEVPGDIVRELIERGRLRLDDRNDPKAIARVLEELIDDAV